MASIELRGVAKRFGAAEVIRSLDLAIPDGKLTVLLGPSGCGKSTLLRLVAGLEEVSAGELLIDGTVVNDLGPKERGCAMVFQNYALYPHKTVAENLAFPLRMEGVDKASRAARVQEVAHQLDISALLDRRPRDLSGGQRQRVAMGRAMIRQPKVFLFDEPLSNLDAELRVRLRLEIGRLQRQLGATMIFVTHDQVEAMTLADTIVVMRGGVIQQIGAPLEIYRRPANRFVAGFIGTPSMNFLNVVGEGTAPSEVMLEDGTHIPLGRIPRSRIASIGIRPEQMRLVPRGSGALGFAAGTLRHAGTENLGDRSFCHLSTPIGPLTVLVAPGSAIEPDMAMDLSFDVNDLHAFDAAGTAV